MARWVLPTIVVGAILFLIWKSKMVPPATATTAGVQPKPAGTPTSSKSKPRTKTTPSPLPPIGSSSQTSQNTASNPPSPLVSTTWGSGPGVCCIGCKC